MEQAAPESPEAQQKPLQKTGLLWSKSQRASDLDGAQLAVGILWVYPLVMSK